MQTCQPTDDDGHLTFPQIMPTSTVSRGCVSVTGAPKGCCDDRPSKPKTACLCTTHASVSELLPASSRMHSSVCVCVSVFDQVGTSNGLPETRRSTDIGRKLVEHCRKSICCCGFCRRRNVKVTGGFSLTNRSPVKSNPLMHSSIPCFRTPLRTCNRYLSSRQRPSINTPATPHDAVASSRHGHHPLSVCVMLSS